MVTADEPKWISNLGLQCGQVNTFITWQTWGQWNTISQVTHSSTPYPLVQNSEVPAFVKHLHMTGSYFTPTRYLLMIWTLMDRSPFHSSLVDHQTMCSLVSSWLTWAWLSGRWVSSGRQNTGAAVRAPWLPWQCSPWFVHCPYTKTTISSCTTYKTCGIIIFLLWNPLGSQQPFVQKMFQSTHLNWHHYQKILMLIYCILQLSLEGT